MYNFINSGLITLWWIAEHYGLCFRSDGDDERVDHFGRIEIDFPQSVRSNYEIHVTEILPQKRRPLLCKFDTFRSCMQLILKLKYGRRIYITHLNDVINQVIDLNLSEQLALKRSTYNVNSTLYTLLRK